MIIKNLGDCIPENYTIIIILDENKNTFKWLNNDNFKCDLIIKYQKWACVNYTWVRGHEVHQEHIILAHEIDQYF